jgi:hypothetical protein
VVIVMSDVTTFVNGLHTSSKVLSYGKAALGDHVVDAVEVENLYGQHIVWGPFSIDNRKGKFIGKMANNANTEGVVYRPN